MKLTPAQADAISARGTNLLVSASAGAGKTEVLARRCVSLVAAPTQPCDIDHLLVVTFTRAAAAELRVRVARMLRAEAAQASPPQRDHLRRQALLIDAADIGTIDAWCQQIVREHFATAAIDPDFTILGEEDAALLRRAVRDELFTQIHRGDEPWTKPARAWIGRATSPDDRFLRSLVERLNRFREHLLNPDAWFAEQRAVCARKDAPAMLASALRDECRFQQTQLATLLAAAPPELRVRLSSYADALQDWQARLENAANLTAVVAEVKACKLEKQRGVDDPPLIIEVRERWLASRLQRRWKPDDVAAILTHAPLTAELQLTLLDLEERYDRMLRTAKRGQAVCEFGDVLRLALDLLGTPGGLHTRTATPIAARLRQRYEHILVDEYQDTSPIQVELLRLVSREVPHGNRFMVGDIKQSIYGFREAEPRLFAQLADLYAATPQAGTVKYLADNFRSHGALLDTLNAIFTRLFDRQLGGTAYGPDERLQAGRAATEIANPTLDNSPRVALHVLEDSGKRADFEDDDDQPPLENERIEREAQVAADEIRSLLDSGVQVPARRGEHDVCLRPLRLADIVVLMRSVAGKAPLVARVLRANGLRCVASGRESLLTALEVRDVCNVLQLLVNRRQDVPLAAYLRGPLVGLSSAELLQIRGACSEHDADFYTAVEHYCTARRSAALAASLDAALQQLDRWATAAHSQELPALLRRILQESGLMLFAEGLRGGAQRVAMLQALTSFAQTFGQSRAAAVDDFVRHVEELAEHDLDPRALAPGDEDVVRVQTIHSAKGLEFPVVILLGAGTRFNRQSATDALQVDEELGLGLRFGDYRARATLTSARHRTIGQRRLQRDVEEELRLLYVAATRARELLLVIGHASADEWTAAQALYSRQPPLLLSRLNVDSHLEWLLMAVAGFTTAAASQVDVVTYDAFQVRTAALPSVATKPAPHTWTDADQQWLSRARHLLTSEIASRTADFPATLSVSALKELASRDRSADQPALVVADEVLLAPLQLDVATAPTDPRTLGQACHRFLELIDLAALADPTALATQRDDLVHAGLLSPAEAEFVALDDLTWLAGTDVGRLLITKAARVRREVPFVYALPLAADAPPTIVRGVIDALLDTPDGLLLLDYKTDTLPDEASLQARVATYSVQLQLYARAAAAIFNRPVRRAVLVFLRGRRLVDVPLDLAALPAFLAHGRAAGADAARARQ